MLEEFRGLFSEDLCRLEPCAGTDLPVRCCTMTFEGRVAFALGSGRCGTKFLAEVLAREPGVASVHERNPTNEAFHRYSQWYGLPVDHEGFLQTKEREIRDDLREHEFSFEASAHLSLSILELFQRFRAKFVLLVRRPDRVVNSHLLKGWYDSPIGRADSELALGYQESRHIHQFLGRIVPSGEEFERWRGLTRVGKLSWYWSAINTRVLDQISEIPETSARIVRLEDLTYDGYLEVADFLGISPTITQDEFDDIARRRPNFLGEVPRVSDWSPREAAEFESLSASMAARFEYENCVKELLKMADDRPLTAELPAHRAPPGVVSAARRLTARVLRSVSRRIDPDGET